MATFAKDTTRAAVEAVALARYPEGDDSPYEDMSERVFALLVDVGAVYADMLADEMGERFARELDGEPATRTLADFLGGPVEVALQGLRENLEMRLPGGGLPGGETAPPV
jgi:hypothetical protein